MLLFRTTMLFGCALCLMAQSDEEYGGPAILSRGEVPTLSTTAPIAFRPYIGVNGIYDNGLLPVVAVSQSGRIPTVDLYGVELNLGLYGYHSWKRTTLALDYKGDFRHYSQKTFYDGSDQFLSLILTHQPSKHIRFTFRNQAGTYSRSYFLNGALGPLDPNFNQLPQNDIFDNRVIFLNTSADLTYRKSARLSFNFGAEGNLVRRRASSLYGITGASTRADMQYRVSRHSTVGLDYRFTHFDYTRGFGSMDLHSVGINYSTQITRHVQLSARVGGARVESLSLVAVPLDPAIALLLGQSVGIQTAYRVNYAPDMNVRLTDNFKRSALSLTYTNSVNPGNGVYLTSRGQSGSISYSYTGVRYWNFGGDVSYGRLSALVQTLGTYNNYGAGVGITRQLGKGFHSVLRLDAHRYDIAANQFRHNNFRAMLGITFSPGDLPLALW